MAKLKIVKIGDETLRKNCRPVDVITPRILQLLDDMVETMRDADGVGLAAPQVGVLRRIVVVETEPGNVIELINPKIIARAGEQIQGSIGRADLAGGNFDQLIEGICSRLFILPAETIVYPGHGAPTSIGSEKSDNPFFR